MKKIAFIGGDKRNLILSEMLKENYKITKALLGGKENSLEECFNSDYIIFSIPFSKDGEKIYTPLSDEELNIAKCVEGVDNKVIFGGNINDTIKVMFGEKNNRVIDIAKNTEFIRNNAIPTAEGIVKCIIDNTDITIDKSNILIVGFGNVGEKTADMLNKLNANVYCNDINKQKVANIKLRGYNVLEKLDNYIEKMDVIINTVPNLIIEKSKFLFIKKSTLIIDVASKPGGVDFVYAKENGYKVIQYLGIPGKVAPRTSAQYMREIIEKYII